MCVPAPVLFPLLPPRQPLSRQPAGAGRGAPGPAFVLGGRSAEHLGGGCTKELGPDPAAAHLPTATGSAVGPRRPGPPNTSGRGGKGLPATGGVCGGLGRFGGGSEVPLFPQLPPGGQARLRRREAEAAAPPRPAPPARLPRPRIVHRAAAPAGSAGPVPAGCGAAGHRHPPT